MIFYCLLSRPFEGYFWNFCHIIFTVFLLYCPLVVMRKISYWGVEKISNTFCFLQFCYNKKFWRYDKNVKTISKCPCQNNLYLCNILYSKYHSEAWVWMIEEDKYIFCIFCNAHVEIIKKLSNNFVNQYSSLFIVCKLLQNSNPVFIIERYI